jgi:hypothetical protein
MTSIDYPIIVNTIQTFVSNYLSNFHNSIYK